MPLWIELLIIVALAIGNGLFAAAEIAVVSLRRSRLKELVAEGHASAIRVEHLRHEPERFFATVQIGITLIGATAAAFGGATLAARTSALLRAAGVGDSADTLALTGVILFVSYVSLVLGELVPKSLALRAAERYALLVARPLLALAAIGRPVIWFLTASSNVILKLFGDRTNFIEGRLSSEELRVLVEDAAHLGAIEPSAGEIASRALEFGRLRVAVVMVPRPAIRAIDVSLSLESARRLAAEVAEDRLPVYERSPDDIIGYVTLRDVLTAGEDRALRDLVRAAHLVPESMLAVDVLREMQRRQTQLAMVIDEHGIVVGIITLEELIEELVGDIFSEHQKPSTPIQIESDGVAIVQGTVPIHEINRALDLALPESEAWSTIAGLTIATLGSIPDAGAKVDLDGVTVEVLEATRRRILTLRLHRPRDATP